MVELRSSVYILWKKRGQSVLGDLSTSQAQKPSARISQGTPPLPPNSQSSPVANVLFPGKGALYQLAIFLNLSSDTAV